MGPGVATPLMVCFQYYILCGHIGVFVLGREEGRGKRGREEGLEGGREEGWEGEKEEERKGRREGRREGGEGGREEGKRGMEGGREGRRKEEGSEGGRIGKEGRRRKRGRPTFDSHPRMLE